MELTKDAPAQVVVDTEDHGHSPKEGHLLGVAFAFEADGQTQPVAFYVPFWSYNADLRQWDQRGEPALAPLVSDFIKTRRLIGHNIEHDREWLEGVFNVTTRWEACTRKMWHLADGKDSPHGFGLKTAQTEILGWPDRGDAALESEVVARGGSLNNGDHYLASVGTLGHYACLDVISTLLLFKHLKPFFDKHQYWPFLKWRIDYHPILSESTREGMLVDEVALIEAKEALSVEKDVAWERIGEICKEDIAAIERGWAEKKAAGYKREKTAVAYLQNPSRWTQRFNPNSALHRTALFHQRLGLPVLGKTPTGRPKSDRATIKGHDHPAAASFVAYSESEAVYKLAKSYEESIRQDASGVYRIHFPYDTCGTVSDRLGGFKPYALNMPFSEERLMSCFKVEAGFIGVHADLAALEPCLIAAFSEDPTLLKVHRDGLGDVYLDLALYLFPEDLDLKAGYDPNIPVTSEVKKRFKRIRDLCKIVHLAIGYTGTESTIFKNVRKAGYKEFTRQDARRVVSRYWQLFGKVQDLEFKLKKLHRRAGFIRNPLGRILQIPEKFEKDTLNRFIQSGGHDVLVAWVTEINKRAKARPELQMRPVLPDIHDSTSWKLREGFYEEGVRIFEDALGDLNSRLGLPVTLRAECKPYRTLAGLKGDER